MANHPHDSSRPESAAVKKALEADDMDALALALTHRQKRFAEEYIVDFNGSAAAIRAGYAIPNSEKQAWTNLQHKGIRAYIDHLSRSKMAQIVSINPDYVIQRVTEIISKESAKDGDRLRGLELLARHLGMFIDRTEITGKDGEAIRVEQQRVEEDADKFLRQLKTIRDKQKKEITLV